MESFAKYYDMPLRVDDYCPSYVWTKNNEMAFNYLDEERNYYVPKRAMEDIVTYK